jgi:hypothetical protein
MIHFVGLDVSQKMTAICVVDNAGHRLWRGQCPTVPEQITVLVRRHAGDDARIRIETGIAFVGYLAAVKPVLKDQIKCPTGERLAAIFGAVGPRSALAFDPGVRKLFAKRVNRLQREIAPIDLDNERCGPRRR